MRVGRSVINYKKFNDNCLPCQDTDA